MPELKEQKLGGNQMEIKWTQNYKCIIEKPLWI